jgi:streptogramin lyase
MFLLKRMLKSLSLVTSVVMLLSLLGAPAWADITEFPLTDPTSGDPGFMTVGPDGNIWFTEERGNKIGRISPQDPGDGSTIVEFELPNPNSNPFTLTVGPDNNLWFTENSGNRIGRITVDGQITEFELPNPNSGPDGIMLGPDGNLWFSERRGWAIGVITPDGQILHEFPITANSYPYAITVGPDGNLWFAENGGDKIGRITVDGKITEFALPHENTGPWGITVGPDGNLWFTENFLTPPAGGGNRIGRITPDGQITEFDLPSPRRNPLNITAGPDGNLWFTEWLGHAIGQMTTDGVLLNEYTVNSTVRGLTVGPDGNIWFTEASGNKIGRLRAPANRFQITATANAVSGTPFDITVTALGSWGNTDTGYQGTVTFSSTDPDSGVALPADYTFTTGVGGDNGVHTFSGGVTLVTVGDQTVTVTDTVSGIAGSATITVGPGP